MSRLLKALGSAAVVAFVFLALPSVLAESDCDADVSVSSQRDDPDRGIRRLAFRVEISATADCAHIHYDLILEIVIPNGQVKKVRKPRIVKLDDGSLSELVEHEIPIDHKLAGYEAKLVECRACKMGT